MKSIKLKINGIETEAEDRTPILAIADKLGISVPTVNTHIRNMYEKLQVHSRSQAVAKYLRA